jgi:hypothetical protein
VSKKDDNEKVEKELKEDAKGKKQKTDQKALEKIQKRTGATKRGNGKK